jgi:hypothetical protein
LGVRLETVQAWGSFFEWRKKLSNLLKDNNEMLIAELWGVVGDVRKRAIRLADYATMWTQEMAQILGAGIKEQRALIKKEEEQVQRIRDALGKLDGKLLKDITSYFKQNVQFEAEAKDPSAREDERSRRGRGDGPTFTGPTLVIMHSRKGGKGNGIQEPAETEEEERRVIELLPAGKADGFAAEDRSAGRAKISGRENPHPKSLWGWEDDGTVS